MTVPDFDLEMVREGTAYISEDTSQPMGRSARMYVPISSHQGIVGFFVCVSADFTEGALRLSARRVQRTAGGCSACG